MNRLRTALTGAAAAALTASLLAGASGSASAASPASAGAGPAAAGAVHAPVRAAAYAKHWITLFEDEDGYRTPRPFSQPTTPSGGIHAGSNYVYCRVWGDKVTGSYGYNHWWLRTDLDWTYPGKPWQNQYIPAYGLSGQGNDQANGIPDC
ncbi:hypothetical protein [Streptomyces sediminimaris]|uniref:hypothetical protein n=1 Tax=Streptomyces sediminimaris TaxID=3383721 RepID=UPI00399C1617